MIILRWRTSRGLRLTTIDHPQEKLGAMAAELLLSMIQNGEKEEGGECSHPANAY